MSGHKQLLQRRWLILIMGLYFAVALTYLWATPPLESSDEYKHYPVVQHYQTTGELPVLDPDSPGRWRQAAAQPPLYYVLMAWVTWGINTSNLGEIHEFNPYVFIGDTRHASNQNLIIHTPELETFPWQGAVLAIYIIRFVSILIGLGTIYLTFKLGFLLAGPNVALLAAGLTAFNPMFLFISAAVNNDSLAAFMGALGIYLLVKVWRDRPDPRAAPFLYAITGIAIGLGAITKLSLAGIGGVAALAFILIAWRQRSWRYLVWSGLLGGLPAILIVAPMLLRNLNLYGDLTGLSAFIAVQGVREVAITLSGWFDEFGTFYRTFWGLFGGLNIAISNWFYGIANGAVVVAILGHLRLRWLAVRGGPAGEGLDWEGGGWQLLLWFGILIVLIIRWTVIYWSFQGRLVFPGLSSFNVLWAVGLWSALAGVKWRPQLLGGFLGAALVAAAIIPWVTIRPVYSHPEPITSVPPEHQFGPITFTAPDATLELVGAAVQPPDALFPDDEPVRITLYWQTDGPTSVDYLSAVSLLGIDGETVARINRYPASGKVTTSRWEAGQIWRDDYDLFVSPEATAPARLVVRVALYDPAADMDLPAFDTNGNQLRLLTVGEAQLRATEPLPLPATPAIPFANGVTLFDGSMLSGTFQSGDLIDLRFYWQVEASLLTDYTVFIHLLDDAGTYVAGADGPPVGGSYPTSWWLPGDVILDTHQLALPAEIPAGRYSIAVGLYDPLTGDRLQRPDGTSQYRLPLTISPPD